MKGSSVVDLRRARGNSALESAGPDAAGRAGNARPEGGLFAEKGQAMACGGLQPATVDRSAVAEADAPTMRRGRPARLTGAVLDAKRAAFQLGVASGGPAPASSGNPAPVLVFVDPQTAVEPAGEAPRPTPARRRIRIAMRLDAKQRRRLNLVAGFTERTAQAVIVAALQAYLDDLVPCSAAVPSKGSDRERGARATSPVRRSQRSLRLHPHLYWRLAIAARNGRCSMQSILACALDSYLDTIAPALCAEVFDCLMGRVGKAGESVLHLNHHPARWRAQSGQPLGRRRLLNAGAHGALPRLTG